jgi:hypothetical protein
MNSVYTINKGINQPVTFKGLKAQYIWWLGGGVLCLFILFALLYLIGVNAFVCLGIIAVAGTGVFMYVYRLSNTYGEHGLMKKAAKRRIPRVVKCTSRKIFC